MGAELTEAGRGLVELAARLVYAPLRPKRRPRSPGEADGGLTGACTLVRGLGSQGVTGLGIAAERARRVRGWMVE